MKKDILSLTVCFLVLSVTGCASNKLYQLPEGVKSALVGFESESKFTAVYVDICDNIECKEPKSIGMFSGKGSWSKHMPTQVFLDLEAHKEITLKLTTKVTLVGSKENFTPKKKMEYQQTPVGLLIKKSYDYSELAKENECSAYGTFYLEPDKYYKLIHYSEKQFRKCSLTLSEDMRPEFE